MRILLATELYAPSVGGIERHVEDLASALGRHGHEVVIATTSPSLGRPERPDGPTVVRIDGWANRLIRRRARPEQAFHPPAADPPVVRALTTLARDLDADVVHAHGWIAHSAVPAAVRAGRPVVVGLHDYGLDCARRSRLQPDGTPCSGPEASDCRTCAGTSYGAVRGPLVVAGLRRSARHWDAVDAFVANSRPVADAARAAGVECSVVPPWIPPTGEHGTPVEGLPDRPFVAYVGALSAHKGIATLTAAWADPVAPLVALVSRPEPGAPALPDDALVHRDVPRDRVLATLARAAVTVVPSTFAEPFGLVATEAMWAGSPVVASAVGGLPEVLGHGRAGLLVPPGDPYALREAVAGLLDDPLERRRLATEGRRRAAELDGTAAIVDCYRRVADGRPVDQPQAFPTSLRT